MINYIQTKHPKVYAKLTSNIIKEAEDYIGSRISLSPVVFSISSNGSAIDILENDIQVGRLSIRVKKIIDITGKLIDVPTKVSQGNYSVSINNFSDHSGEYCFIGTSLYVNGRVNVVCYCYPKLSLQGKWSDTMLSFFIPFAYYKISIEEGDLSSAGLYEAFLNRLISLYNKAKSKPISQPISRTMEAKPYEL